MPSPALTEIPVRSSRALTRRWVFLLQPPVFGARSLWLSWFGADGRQLPLVTPIDDIPLRPDPDMLFGLTEVVDSIAREHAGPGAHVAMALCRPGEAEMTDDDAAWGPSLGEALDERLDGTWSLHLAAGGRVEPLVDPWNGRRRASAARTDLS